MHWYYADITWVSPLQFRSATTVVLNRLTWSLFLRYTALFFNQVNKRFFYRIRNCCEITKIDITEKHPFIKSLNLIAYKVFRLPSVMLMKLVTCFLRWNSTDSLLHQLTFEPRRFIQNVELELNFVLVTFLIPGWSYNTHAIWVE